MQKGVDRLTMDFCVRLHVLLVSANFLGVGKTQYIPNI